ncbi:MAG: glycosyl transferase group 1 [Pedosphaera sp.]|nr:glycosyl transferase group 1 [Pedosphaera sp.]
MQVFLATCGAWHLRDTAKAFEARDALAAIWCTEKNRTGISPARYQRCWPFHLAMAPFYFYTPQIWIERAFYALLPVWRIWLRKQLRAQKQARFNVVHSVMGYSTEMFDFADQIGALKVVDCPNSHPTSYYGNWQRECDLWCPGEKVPIPQWMFSRMNRELEQADLIIVQSQFCKDSMVLNGLPEEKVMINIMGVDTSLFKKRQQLPSKPRFICVGTICLRKGHQYLFRAFQKVKQVLPEAELICVGHYKTDFRMERPKWEGTFTHIPVLSPAEVGEHLRTATAFIFPSQEEGIARAQIEALASGLPVIGTYPGGTTTVVRDGVEGFIVPPHDVTALANAMIRVATDADLNMRMGEAAYQRGGLRNSWQDYGDRFLADFTGRLEKKAVKSSGRADS